MGLSEAIPYTGSHTEDDVLMFGRYLYLYPIIVADRRFWVPENNTVLRSLQYLSVKSGVVRLPWHKYCWNNRDGCCNFMYRAPDGPCQRKGRACAKVIEPGLQIVRLPEGGVLCPPEH